jgi:hypothetical protein
VQGIVFGGDSTGLTKISEVAKRPKPKKVTVLKPTVAVDPKLAAVISNPPKFSLTASEEHTLVQVIRLIGFEEALRRLIR